MEDKKKEQTSVSNEDSKEVPKSFTQALIRAVWPSGDSPENFSQAIIRVVWSSRLRFLYLIGIIVIVTFYSFSQPLVTEFILRPFFSEKTRVMKYNSQLNYSASLLQSADPTKQIKGVSLLQELAISYPYKRQELVSLLQKFIRQSFPQENEIDPTYLPALKQGIETITTIPRHDANGHPLNIDMHQIRIEHLDLTNTNFKDVVLWGCQFYDVIFARSNFENSDLGGALFINCSLEYAKMKKAKLCGSFMDNRPTRFIKTRLWGTNLEEAEIENVELIPHEHEKFDFNNIKFERFISNDKLRINPVAITQEVEPTTPAFPTEGPMPKTELTTPMPTEAKPGNHSGLKPHRLYKPRKVGPPKPSIPPAGTFVEPSHQNRQIGAP